MMLFTNERVRKILRFLVAGATGFLINIGVYSLLIYRLGMWYVLASVIAFFVALVISFLIQKFYAFRDHSAPGHGKQFGHYFLFMLFNLCANASILFVVVDFLGVHKLVALVISSGVIAVWSFFMYEYVIFKVPATVSEHTGASRVSLSDVSVVIPCYNEEDSIRRVIEAVPHGVKEIIVVDNNSTDRSAQNARACGARVITETTQGYGAALRSGFLSAQGNIIVAFDADNQYPAEKISPILEFLTGEGLDFVSASRFPLEDYAAMDILHRVGNWGLTLAANVLFGLSLGDSQSGMWLFRRSILGKILPANNDMPFSQELKIRAARDPRIRFAEYHIPYHVRIGESKLFPFRHGVILLVHLLAMRFGKGV